MSAATLDGITLAQAIDHYAVDVFDHLDREICIPIFSGKPQRQGDVILLPRKVKQEATTMVGRDGHAVVRGENGGNTHLLLEGFGGPIYFDPASPTAADLTLGLLTVPAGSVAYLAHPEHGYMGFGPGSYTVRRQREQADELRLVAD